MKRVWIVLTAALLAALLLATPVLAGGGNGPGHGTPPVFALQGYISGKAAPTFEVTVVKSMNGADLPNKGETATIYTNSETVYYEYHEVLGVIVRDEISFGLLEIGDPVSVTGNLEGDELWATQVTVNPYCEQLAGDSADD